MWMMIPGTQQPIVQPTGVVKVVNGLNPKDLSQTLTLMPVIGKLLFMDASLL
jgi:hypothetical protein